MSEICDKLCGLILEGKSELRDIYSIGLKTLISDIPEAMGKSVAQRLCGRLLGGIQQVGISVHQSYLLAAEWTV